MTDLFQRRLVWATHFGVWPRDFVAAVFGVSSSVVKDVGAGRFYNRDVTARQFHLNPYGFTRRYVPDWLLAALDNATPTNRNALMYDTEHTNATNQQMVGWWRDRFNKSNSAPKFNETLRNAVLLEATRRDEHNDFVWPDRAFVGAFDLNRSTIDEMRNGAGGVYSAFHEEFEQRRVDYIRTALCDEDVPENVIDAILSTGEHYGDDSPLFRRVLYESYTHATSVMDSNFNQLIFDVLNDANNVGVTHDNVDEIARKLRIKRENVA